MHCRDAPVVPVCPCVRREQQRRTERRELNRGGHDTDGGDAWFRSPYEYDAQEVDEKGGDEQREEPPGPGAVPTRVTAVPGDERPCIADR